MATVPVAFIYPEAPEPATVVTTPAEVTFRILSKFVFATYKFLLESIQIPIALIVPLPATNTDSSPAGVVFSIPLPDDPVHEYTVPSVSTTEAP